MTKIDGMLPFRKYIEHLGISRRRRGSPELTPEAAERMREKVMAHWDEIWEKIDKSQTPPDEPDQQ